MDMQWLRDFVAALSPQRHGFNSTRLHFVFVADKMGWDSFFSKYFGYTCHSIPPEFRDLYSCISAMEKPSNNSFKIQVCPVSTGNTFKDLPWLRETADNNKSYVHGIT
jgi:hypothetical protein